MSQKVLLSASLSTKKLIPPAWHVLKCSFRIFTSKIHTFRWAARWKHARICPRQVAPSTQPLWVTRVIIFFCSSPRSEVSAKAFLLYIWSATWSWLSGAQIPAVKNLPKICKEASAISKSDSFTHDFSSFLLFRHVGNQSVYVFKILNTTYHHRFATQEISHMHSTFYTCDMMTRAEANLRARRKSVEILQVCRVSDGQEFKHTWTSKTITYWSHILITYIHIQHTSANVNYISRSLISPNSLLFIASSLSHNTLLKLIFGRLSQRIPIYPIFSGRNKISWYHESPELANLELNLCTPEPATT